MIRRKRPPACEAVALPHGLTYARFYISGWRCNRHTPAAEKGRPESPTGPGWPIHRQPLPDTPEAAAPTGADHEQEPMP